MKINKNAEIIYAEYGDLRLGTLFTHNLELDKIYMRCDNGFVNLDTGIFTVDYDEMKHRDVILLDGELTVKFLNERLKYSGDNI